MSLRGFLAFLLGVALAAALGIGTARAGYYATVTATASSYYSKPVGSMTQCMLTPSMAAAGVNAGTYGATLYLTQLSETEAAGYIKEPAFTFSASIAPCTAAPVASALPVMLGGVVDPVIASGNYNNTGGTGSNPDPIQPLNPALAIEDSTALLGLGMLFLVPVWGSRKLYDIFTSGGLS